jgi:hypothetical protein
MKSQMDEQAETQKIPIGIKKGCPRGAAVGPVPSISGGQGIL